MVRLERWVWHLPQRHIVFAIKVLFDASDLIAHTTTQDTHDLAHQHDVLPAYQKEANVLLRPEVGMIYLLPGVL